MAENLYSESEVAALLLARMGGKNQQDFAREVGISAPALSKTLNGKCSISKQVLDFLSLESAGKVYRRKKGK